jgi:hypothetical protein
MTSESVVITLDKRQKLDDNLAVYSQVDATLVSDGCTHAIHYPGFEIINAEIAGLAASSLLTDSTL